jgi:hypothetical protein
MGYNLRSAKDSRISRRWLAPGEEPALSDVLADPVLHAVMRRDGVTMPALCNHIAQARARLGYGPAGSVWAEVGPCRCAA